MKKFLLAGIVSLALQFANAQKIYFIYIQSENNAPFFVKTGDKITSSTASGYLILPKLVDSVYQFAIGKTGQAAGAESRFAVTINKKDRGFLLREAEGKLALFDLQALTLQQPVAAAFTSTEAIAKRTDAFTVLLAQAANDPSLLEIHTPVQTAQLENGKTTDATPALAVTTKAPEKEKAPAQTESTAIADQSAASANTPAPTKAEAGATVSETPKDTVQQSVAAVSEPAQNEAPDVRETYKPSVVKRKSESSTSEGFGLVFLDETESGVDTIRLVIPNQSITVRKEEPVDGDLKRFLNITNADTAQTAVTVEAANSKLAAAKKKSTCTTAASDKDFLKLRKNMAAEASDKAMINEAQKAFKRSCFSTEQIKNLSSLFLSASGKYHFFDAAYGHVSDQQQYAVLQTELNDDYYVNRFKALIAKQ